MHLRTLHLKQNQEEMETSPENRSHHMLMLAAVIAIQPNTHFNRPLSVHTFVHGQ